MRVSAYITTAMAVPIASSPMANTGDATLLVSKQGEILVTSFNGQDFAVKQTFDTPGNPSWLTLHNGRVYAVDENSQLIFGHSYPNKVLTSGPSVAGSGPMVHLESGGNNKNNNNRLIGAGFGSSTIDVWNTTNSPPKLLKTIKVTDPVGPVKDRQDKPHPHQVVKDPTGRFFAVNDLGTDKILLLDGKDDAFTIVNKVSVTPGCGPRHGAFYPSAKATHYILLCEISNLVKVFALEYKSDKIEFKEVQSESTFGKTAPKGAAAGELVLSKDNKHVYVSNRLTEPTDTIAHFTVDKGKIAFVGLTSTSGKLPRMFSESKDGKYLFVGNQGGDNGLVALKRGDDGKLDEKPVARMPMSEFKGQGPAFVQQV